jgi:predicted ATPase
MQHPHYRYLTSYGLSFNQLATLWDKITLTPKEDSVINAMQILEPKVERISFTSRPTAAGGILVKLHGQTDPVPLGSLGDGTRRILTLAASEVMAENGVLLVDEIDTGLYYRTQADMWRLLIGTAQRLNVQVFATTHSSDCVRAFQEALSQTKDSSVGKLFRLSLRDEKIHPVSFTADELAIAIRQDIEVR